MADNARKRTIHNKIVNKLITIYHISAYLKDRIQKMQNRCIRFIFGLRKYDHISNYFTRLKWLNLKQRRKLHFACFIFKIKQSNCPTYLNDMLISTSDCHQYNTRQKLFIYSINNTSGSKMFKYFAPKFWNDEIPNDIKNISIFNTFKKAMTEYILTIEE